MSSQTKTIYSAKTNLEIDYWVRILIVLRSNIHGRLRLAIPHHEYERSKNVFMAVLMFMNDKWERFLKIVIGKFIVSTSSINRIFR
jgi:hypothetical protein